MWECTQKQSQKNSFLNENLPSQVRKRTTRHLASSSILVKAFLKYLTKKDYLASILDREISSLHVLKWADILGQKDNFQNQNQAIWFLKN